MNKMQKFCEPKSESQEWYTPPYIFQALGITFDLDAASPGLDKTPWIPAKEAYTITDNGLEKPWFGHVWCNPPYGLQIPLWIKKMNEHQDGIMMLYSRTDTRWFQQEIHQAHLACFVSGRIRSIRGDGYSEGIPGCGHMLAAWGEECVTALWKSKLGVLYRPCGGS